MVFNLCVVTLVIAIAFVKISNGLHCYECVDLHGDLKNLIGIMRVPPEDLCDHKISKTLTKSCPAEQPYCLKAIGTVLNGKHMEVRSCGSASHFFKNTLDHSSCQPFHEITDFKFNIGTHGLEAETGEVCLCETDKCNSAQNFHPVKVFIVIGIIHTIYFVLSF